MNLTTGKLALGFDHIKKDDLFVILSETPDQVWVALEDPKINYGVVGCVAIERERYDQVRKG